MIKPLIKSFLRNLGVELSRFPPPPAFRRDFRILKDMAPEIILDVGANKGEFVDDCRENGCNGRILCFEPRKEAFQALGQRAASDPKVEVYNLGLGAADEMLEINVSGNPACSSVLPMLELHTEAARGSEFIAKEMIQLRTLNSFWPEVKHQPGDKVLLKIDVQGFEGAVLDGASDVMPLITAIHVELSLRSLYEGSPLVEDMISRLRPHGFVPVALMPAYGDPRNMHLLQADGLFVRV